MRVYMNNLEVEIKEATLLTLLTSQSLHDTRGIAVAVNEEVIPRNEWAARALQDSDKILIISATQGG